MSKFPPPKEQNLQNILNANNTKIGQKKHPALTTNSTNPNPVTMKAHVVGGLGGDLLPLTPHIQEKNRTNLKMR